MDWVCKQASITLSTGIILGLMAVWAELPLNVTGLDGLVFSGITEYDVGLAMVWESNKEKVSFMGWVAAHKPCNLWGSLQCSKDHTVIGKINATVLLML